MTNVSQPLSGLLPRFKARKGFGEFITWSRFAAKSNVPPPGITVLFNKSDKLFHYPATVAEGAMVTIIRFDINLEPSERCIQREKTNVNY